MNGQINEGQQGEVNPEGCEKSTNDNDRGAASFPGILRPAIVQFKTFSAGGSIADLAATRSCQTCKHNQPNGADNYLSRPHTT